MNATMGDLKQLGAEGELTTQANVTFGDVRETADVNKIFDVIQDMVDEELATSLVVG